MPRAGIIASAKVIAGGGGGTTGMAFRQSAVDATDLTTYTFTAQAIGTASSTRRVVVAIGYGGAAARTLTTATIGGVTASVDVDSTAISSNRRVYIVSAVVPTGTTADVVVTLSGAATRMGIGLWTLASGAPTGQTAVSPNLASGSLTVTTSSGQAVICAGYSSSTSTPDASSTWTGATERYDQQVEDTINSHTGADVVASGASTVVSYSTTGSTSRGFVAAAYA